MYLQETIWLIVSVLLAYAVCYPITSQAEFVPTLPNFLIVILSFTYIRYIVTFRSLWFLKTKNVRVGWFILNMFLFIFILNRLESMLTSVDSYAVFEIFHSHNLNLTEEKKLLNYFQMQYTLFTVASFLGIAGFNMRILMSFWSKSKVVKQESVIIK
jgi:hypothetical protein